VAPFTIEIFQNYLLVGLRGKWDMSTNIHYLSKLASSLQRCNGKAFHMVVDMRGWQIPNDTISEKIKAPIHLDRRNQRSEIWLEDSNTVADHIAEKVASEQSVHLLRTDSTSRVIEWVRQYSSAAAAERISQWLADNKVDKQN